MGHTLNTLPSPGLWWWEHKTIKDFHEHCMEVEFIDPRKTTLYLRIQSCPSNPITAFKSADNNF
jgi:hypothetical protein